jgi:hypothetical protein
MVAHRDGRFVCSSCGQLAHPRDKDSQCICTKYFELGSAELTANLSGVVRALRQQLLRAQEQMEQIDAAIAVLGSLNVPARSHELAAAAGGKIAAAAQPERGESRRSSTKKKRSSEAAHRCADDLWTCQVSGQVRQYPEPDSSLIRVDYIHRAPSKAPPIDSPPRGSPGCCTKLPFRSINVPWSMSRKPLSDWRIGSHDRRPPLAA